ncbi:MAG: PAS domain S-box protein, partial [Deltaproteobacteria bacterium]|nr:PAS domain S-box protein [Deltaproteobacteria bacterium]
MGVLCLFHATLPPGDRFVFSRSLADLVGAVLVSLGWMVPKSGGWVARRTGSLAAVVVSTMVVAGVWFLATGDSSLPTMMVDGRFTPLLVGIKLVSGVGFLSGAGLVLLHSPSLRRLVCWPLAACLLVFGVSSLLFSWWSLWGGQWWAWHVLSAAGPVAVVAALGLDYQHALRKISESEAQLRVAFENATVGRSLTLANGRLARVNRAFGEMIGYTVEEMQTFNFANVTHPDDLAISRESIRCLLAGEQSTFLFEKRYLHRDGHEVWTQVSTTLVRDDSGAPLNFVTDIVDITDRKRGEEALRLSQRELAIGNRLSRIFLTAKAEDTYTEVLNVFLEAMDSKFGVFGYIDEAGAFVVPTMTRHIWDKCRVANKEFVFPRASWGNSSWPTAIREKRTIYSNEPSTCIPVGHIAIERHISLPLIHRGDVIGLLQVANKETDYTPADVALFEAIGNIIAPVLYERVQTERQERIRHASEELFRSFFKLTADLAPIARLSDARFIEINPAWEKTLGYTQEELTSRSFLDFIHPDDKEPTLRVVREKLERGELVLRFENRYLRKDGGVVWLEWTSQPFEAQDRTFAMARDVTRRKEEELKAAEQDWLKTGIADLNDAIRTQADLRQLCAAAVSQMAGRLDAKVGAVYTVDQRTGGQVLAFAGGFAFSPGTDPSGSFELGEGLVGQAALDRRLHVLRDVPSDYLRIVSGTGETR